ncbi:hypothetical protein [Rothia mucilaginosa]|uniref:hypothetical protein n=1 Tax=Rothia mucilaginosa TaxID=43675 RepID=UPI0028DBFB68|nr:hypothetical protein [Rothia mucilaginosa]
MSISFIALAFIFLVPAIAILAGWFFLRGYLRKLERAKRRSPVGIFIMVSIIVYLNLFGLLLFFFG